jgi:ABC-2 type transport system permease protein
MRSILVLVANTLKVTFRKKSNIIVFIIIPIVSILVSMALYSSTGTSRLKIGVYDKDNSGLSKDLISSMSKAGKFDVTDVEEDKINEMITIGKLDCAVIIPYGFEKGIYNNEAKQVKLVSLKGVETTVWIKNYTNLYVMNLLDISKVSQGNLDTFNKIYGGYKKESLKLEIGKVEDRSQSRGITMQSLGFLILFMMLGASFTSSLILKEKRDRTYFRVCTAPVSPKIYIISNVIANLIIVFIQVLTVLIIATKVFGISTYVPSYQLATILICFGLVSIGIGMLVVSFSKSTIQANNLSTIIISPTCMLGGCFWPPSMMPETIQKISNFMPQKWAIDAINKIQMGSSFFDVMGHIAIMIAFATVFFLVAIYMFSNRDDVKNFV